MQSRHRPSHVSLPRHGHRLRGNVGRGSHPAQGIDGYHLAPGCDHGPRIYFDASHLSSDGRRDCHSRSRVSRALPDGIFRKPAHADARRLHEDHRQEPNTAQMLKVGCNLSPLHFAASPKSFSIRYHEGPCLSTSSLASADSSAHPWRELSWRAASRYAASTTSPPAKKKIWRRFSSRSTSTRPTCST